MSHSLGTSIGSGKGPAWQMSIQQVAGTAKSYPRELHFGHRATRKRGFSWEGARDTLHKCPHNETWASSGARTAEEAEILHVDVRSVSLGMGKGGFLWTSRSTTSTKTQNWGVGLHGEEPASLGWGICPCHAGRIWGMLRHCLVSCIVSHLSDCPPHPDVTSHCRGDSPQSGHSHRSWDTAGWKMLLPSAGPGMEG